MRIIFIILLLPFAAKAQINRSASELAKENIKAYISSKIYKDRPYRSVSYGELKPNKEMNTTVFWRLEHRFEITEAQRSDKGLVTEQQPHKFIFYLDKKMKVVKAESIQF